MNIFLQEIKFKNFLSYGDEYTNINFENGLDLLIGLNGKGKSVLADSLFYALFGKPFRKIKLGKLINRITKKKLEVQLLLKIDNKQYKIIRGMSPNKFEIYVKKDDEFILIRQLASAKEYQKYFEEEIIQINETVFRQLIVLGANIPSSKPFMELSAQEKETLFQILTDTKIFNDLKDIIKEKIKIYRIESKELNYRRDILENSINSEESMIAKAEEQNNNFKKHKENNRYQ